MNAPLQVGIIGSGVIAPTHVRAYQALPDVQVRWVCDLVEEKARRTAAEFGIPNVTTDSNDVFTDPRVDAVSICTDHASHAPLTIAALDAGKHVLCEKALAATAEGLDRMVSAGCRHPELVFGGVFQHRFDPVYRRLKEVLTDGELGAVLTSGVQVRCLRPGSYYRADKWRGTWEQEGGAVLINQAIHFLDILNWISGDIQALCGTHANLTHGPDLEAEDTAVAILRFANGSLGTLEATCSSHINWEPTLSVHGENGSIEIRNGIPAKVAFADDDRENEILRTLNAPLDTDPSISGKSYYGGGHASQLRDFVDAIREKRSPLVTFESAASTVRLVLGIYRSHRENRWIALG